MRPRLEHRPARRVDQAPPGSSGELLVALDHDEATERGLPVAITLARWLDMSLRLAHVVSGPRRWTPWRDATRRRAEREFPRNELAAQRTANLAGRLQDATRVPVAATTVRGLGVGAQLADVARHHRADAIIIRPRTHPPRTRATFGRVARSLLRHGPAPVVVMPRDLPPHPPEGTRDGIEQLATAWAWQHRATEEWTVVVALDGTSRTARLIEGLDALMRAGNVHLALTYVATPETDVQERVDAIAVVAETADRLRRDGRSTSINVVRAVDVPSGLAEAALDRSAAMVALAGSGRRLLRGLVTESVTARLARTIDVPLWVVPPPVLGEGA